MKISCIRGEPSGQATQALLALYTLSLLSPFTLCLNILYFNYFKGIFHTFICVLWTYLLAAAGFGRLEQRNVVLYSASWRHPSLQTIENRIYLSYCERGGSGVVNRRGPNAIGEVTAFNPNIHEGFRIQRGSSIFFFFGHKEGGGHRSFADVGSSHGFLKGSCGPSPKALATGSTVRIRSCVLEGWRFSSLLRIQTAPGIRSAYYEYRG